MLSEKTILEFTLSPDQKHNAKTNSNFHFSMCLESKRHSHLDDEVTTVPKNFWENLGEIQTLKKKEGIIEKVIV